METKLISNVSVLVCCALIAQPSFSQPADPDALSFRSRLMPQIDVIPKYPVAIGDSILLSVFTRNGPACVRSPQQIVESLGTKVNRSGNSVVVDNAFSIIPLDNVSICATVFPISLGTFQPGKYTVRAIPFPGPYPEDRQRDEPILRTQEITFAVLTKEQAQKALIEIPAADSVQSGVGLISGWACIADDIELALNGGARIRVPSESGRADVEPVCSHPNAGFGLLFNYNTLSEGDHALQLYVKGVAMGEPRKFKVVRPKGEFARGLTRTVTVPDFPEPGKTTTLDWREAEQRFGIREVK